MSKQSLTAKKCVPCEGGIPKFTADEVAEHSSAIPEWSVNNEQTQIERKWTLKNFVQCVELLNRVADLAEDEGHHPDFHLTSYRKLRIVLSTHAVGGLTENDFIMAAKIDELHHQPTA